MLSTEIQRSVRLNKKKKSTNISPYPDEAIERLARAFYPAILACWNSEEGQREFAAWQAEQAHIATKEKQEVPVGELPALLIVCGFFRVRPGGRTLFYLNLDKCIIILYRYFCSPFFSLCSSMYLFISAMSVWCFPLFTH